MRSAEVSRVREEIKSLGVQKEIKDSVEVDGRCQQMRSAEVSRVREEIKILIRHGTKRKKENRWTRVSDLRIGYSSGGDQATTLTKDL
ncbi:unnamed protein product [Caenorhabditis sp. 36 PRJEB53466]|nr:unnamed protein product [Caenorhabditis sp. 36 PRJEB53466]